MPADSSGAREGLVMAAGVVAITAFFTWRQISERKSRDAELSLEDADYYSRRDRRRVLGTSILGLIGLCMLFGSLIEPRAHPAAFVSLWLLVAMLVFVSLVLALLDLRANQHYAKRHRRLLMDERRTLLQEELRRHIAGQNGHGDPLT